MHTFHAEINAFDNSQRASLQLIQLRGFRAATFNDKLVLLSMAVVPSFGHPETHYE